MTKIKTIIVQNWINFFLSLVHHTYNPFMGFCPSAALFVGKQWDTKHLDSLSAKLARGENTLPQQLRLLDGMREDNGNF